MVAGTRQCGRFVKKEDWGLPWDSATFLCGRPTEFHAVTKNSKADSWRSSQNDHGGRIAHSFTESSYTREVQNGNKDLWLNAKATYSFEV
ncbi:hypothetical protein NL676_002080 [Syzygium grande]|nr:hypothetical protein NL676_002080 [Syzygium grande]